MISNVRSAETDMARAGGGSWGAPPRRLLIAAGLALAVLGPTLHNATLVRAGADLGMGDGARGWAQVLVVCASLAGVFSAGWAADRLGARCLVVWSLFLSAAGGLLVVAAWDAWSYQAGLVLESAGVMGAVAGFLAAVPAVNLTGRLSYAVGAVFAMLAAALVAAVVLALIADSVGGWRAVEAVLPLASVSLVLPAARLLPVAPAARPAQPLPLFWPGSVVVIVLGGVLQANPLRYWQDFEILVLLVATLAVLGLMCLPVLPWRGRPWRAKSGAAPEGWGDVGAVLMAGGAWGFAQSALATVLLVLLAERGMGQDESLVAWAGFGIGFVAAGAYGAKHAVRARVSATLGLTLAAVSTALLSALAHGHGGGVTALAALLTALAGFGVALAQIPYSTRFLAGLPSRARGKVAAVYPASVVLGGAAVTGIPYESALAQAAEGASFDDLLWMTVSVLVLASVVLGRSVVALAVAGAAAAQYLLVVALSDDVDARRPWAIAAYLLVGSITGLMVWARGRQRAQLARSVAAATALQEAVLRPLPAQVGGLELGGLYRPATAGVGVGGDFYDVASTDFGTRILIGDVRGKGLGAVQTVADVLGCFRSQAHETVQLSELAARLDRHLARAALARDDAELFATALLLEYREGEPHVWMLNCGHLAPATFGADRRVQDIELPTALPLGLGVLGLPSTQATAVPIPAGTVLLLYTDGLSEARDASGVFYPLAERLPALPHSSMGDLLRQLVSDVEQWTHRLGDDIALITVTRANPQPPGARQAGRSA
ncbi:SpoIIE family protein phosphatase [Streptomyces sp. NPDC001904]|uniref:SpoIIE family protein phosphatase n=1 Tax=Streptomyces sp. NPDC001904 TaxID=3154531 RepID=UPI00331B8F5B